MITSILSALVAIYRVVLSPLSPPSCRYFPTCSEYAQDALHMHGAFLGCYLTLRRLLRCHPFGGNGLDPVPTKRNFSCKP